MSGRTPSPCRVPFRARSVLLLLTVLRGKYGLAPPPPSPGDSGCVVYPHTQGCTSHTQLASLCMSPFLSPCPLSLSLPSTYLRPVSIIGSPIPAPRRFPVLSSPPPPPLCPSPLPSLSGHPAPRGPCPSAPPRPPLSGHPSLSLPLFSVQ